MQLTASIDLLHGDVVVRQALNINWVVDTGATFVVIDDSVARDLKVSGLDPIPVRVQAAAGAMTGNRWRRAGHRFRLHIFNDTDDCYLEVDSVMWTKSQNMGVQNGTASPCLLGMDAIRKIALQVEQMDDACIGGFAWLRQSRIYEL